MSSPAVYTTSSEAPCAVTTSPHPTWKRALDLAICLLVFPFLALVTLVFACLLSLTSPGPILFRQERVGYMGRRFRIYKFRTMHVGAKTTTHQAHFAQLVRSNVPMQKMDARGDSRLVAGGWFLRATGLDELPQIINVFKGDMSIVGPRPCIPYEYEEYTASQRRRFHALPGITGLWQVSGKNRTTFEEMIRFDIEYSQRKSFWLDVKILFLTPYVLFSQCVENRRARVPQAATGQDRTG